jgi:hypothetical protein
MSPRLAHRLLALAFAIALAACGRTPAAEVAVEPTESVAVVEPTSAPELADPTAAPTAPAPTAAAAELPVKDVYAVGDSAPLEPFVVTVSDARAVDEVDGTPAAEDMTYVLVDLSLENTGGEPQDVSMLIQMVMEDADGGAYAVDVGASVSAVMDLNGRIDAGERASGTIGFQIPADASEPRFIFRTIEPGATAERGRAAFAVEL